MIICVSPCCYCKLIPRIRVKTVFSISRVGWWLKNDEKSECRIFNFDSVISVIRLFVFVFYDKMK